MPWYPRYYQRRRRYWLRRRRPRKTFWRRRRRRNYYRRYTVRRKKLKSLLLREFQPQTIHKCKIKGSISLFWGPPERFSHNYELYELAIAPPKLPSGGLFSIKNFSLQALFAENQYVRNIWTKTNNHLPLVRYTGCTMKFYRSLHIDYITSYSNALPLTANLDMYQSMHPSVHNMLQHKIIVTRKKYNHQKKPYKKIHIKPPTPLLNKWYLQHDLANIPLVQIRTSAASFDEWYINWRSVSTTISITYLTTAFQNYNFKNVPTGGYHIRKTAGKTYYLYSTGTKNEITDNTNWTDLIFLGNTNKYQQGNKIQFTSTEQETQYLQKNNKTTWGNPFYTKYLTSEFPVYYCEHNLATIYNLLKTSTTSQKKPITECTKTHLTDTIRYNPFRDEGKDNTVWLQSVKTETDKLEPPQNEILKSSHLPLYILLHGFEDFQKKNHTVTGIDTDNMIIVRTNFRTPAVLDTLPLIDISFIQGKSPYEDSVNPLDTDRWYPCTQYQQTTITNITSSGPGSPKVTPLNSIEAKMDYTFYFKWGGNPPPMETVTDPEKQPEIHLPSNFIRTPSLQNPTNRPEYLLYNFDERRGLLTKKALKRLQTTWDTEKYFISDGSHFAAKIQTPEETSSEETTSEEEEETQNLLLKLRKQQHKNKQLKLRILKSMGVIQK
nr:MAG: ORF1 [TTV-like mini virus]